MTFGPNRYLYPPGSEHNGDMNPGESRSPDRQQGRGECSASLRRQGPTPRVPRIGREGSVCRQRGRDPVPSFLPRLDSPALPEEGCRSARPTSRSRAQRHPAEPSPSAAKEGMPSVWHRTRCALRGMRGRPGGPTQPAAKDSPFSGESVPVEREPVKSITRVLSAGRSSSAVRWFPRLSRRLRPETLPGLAPAAPPGTGGTGPRRRVL